MANKEQKQTRQAITRVEQNIKKIKEDTDAIEEEAGIISHGQLAGVTSSQHHTRYSDIEAVTAAKADGDISDAIDKRHSSANQVASSPIAGFKKVTNIYIEPQTGALIMLHEN